MVPSKDKNLIKALFFGKPLKTLNNWNPPSLVSPAAINFLASAKTPIKYLLWIPTISLTKGFNSLNSCRSPCGTGPEMINGVLASSIKTESTSSIIA